MSGFFRDTVNKGPTMPRACPVVPHAGRYEDRWMRRWLVRGLLGLAVACGAAGSLVLAQTQEPDPKSGSSPASPAAETAPANPLDRPLQWLHEAREAHKAIRDYTCTLVKQERVQGRLQEQNIMLMKFRNQPFSVYMRWLAPHDTAGQEVAFIAGRNNNKMRVHRAKAIVSWVSVDPNDPRVIKQSRHTIYEAGIGSLIEQLISNLEKERQLNKTQVRIALYTYNNRRCTRVETIRTERSAEAYGYRSVFYLDKDSKMPIRAENYDWPSAGGPSGGELMEEFSFVDLRFNLGLGDADFNR